jgi:sulfur-oxidizing protein SoxY
MTSRSFFKQCQALGFAGLMLVSGSLLTTSHAVAAPHPVPADPLESVMWDTLAKKFFSSGPIVFDARVRVLLPEAAEDQFFVPVTIDASGLQDVQEIVVLTDLNPIAHVLTYRPERAEPFIGLRVKVEQTTPVRAGVRTADGTWHIGGAIVEAAGGGCTAPALAHGQDDWARTLGDTRVRVNRVDSDAARVTVRMRHPMDTGLAFGYSAFFMNRIEIRDADRQVLSSLDLYEPVSENPTLTIMPRVGAAAQAITVDARDSDGNEFGYSVAIPAGVSAD